jgi:hypothetical protein
MELEELKKTWSSLDGRLEQQEIWQTAVRKENLISRSDRHLSRMINYGYFGLTLCVAGLAVQIWALTLQRPLYLKAEGALTMVIVLYAIVMGVKGLVKLQKIDFTMPVSENIRQIQAYQVWYHVQLKVILAGAALLVVGIIVLFLFFMKVQPWLWTALAGAVSVGAVGSWWEYKRMYQRNVGSILQNMNELKESGSEE